MSSSNVDFLQRVFEEQAVEPAIVGERREASYGWLLERLAHWRARLDAEAIARGSVVILQADFSPESVAAFLGLVERDTCLVPLTRSVETHWDEFVEVAQGEVVISIGAGDQVQFRRVDRTADHEHYRTLRQRRHPGLVLFSSGSTGKCKAAVHDLLGILEKFRVRRQRLRTLTFLLFDHIGGVNTMLYTLSNGGCMVTIGERDPDVVAQAIERWKVELLPTSPTFLNLLLLSEAHRRHDLSSLRTVTYGTEPMPESTLRRFHTLFPGVKLQQTYGLSEIGILRSKSKSSDSLWVKLGGEGVEMRVVDGILQVKTRSAMLGYLNAPSPFTADGWFVTGDAVLQDGEYLRILGRESEIINVGGEKVYPAEVESCLLQMPGVRDVSVYGNRHPITGEVVAARFNLEHAEDPRDFKRRLREYCRERLQPFKIPVKIEITSEALFSERVKKTRPRGQLS